MGEFYAWGSTGIVAGLQTWSIPEKNYAPSQQPNDRDSPAYAERVMRRQRFLLRQHQGRDIEILLADSGMVFKNGHAITAVWAAREKAPYGHCIYLENHTSGAIARLTDNIELIRHKARWWKIAVFGFLATLPATIALIGWLILKRGPSQIYDDRFLVSVGIAAFLLFIIGVVASKLVFDYFRAEDERKIWVAADKALFHARRLLIQKPRSRRYV